MGQKRSIHLSRSLLTLAGVFARLAGGEAGARPTDLRLESMPAEAEKRAAAQLKTKQSKAKQSKVKQSKAKQIKAKQCKEIDVRARKDAPQQEANVAASLA